MRLLLIRHGEPDYSIDSLTPKGWREAKLLANRFSPEQDIDLYVSPLGRARDTVSPTEEKLGKKAVVLPWLAEFRGKIDHPDFQNKDMPWDISPKTWTADPLLFDRERWVTGKLMADSNVPEIWEETKAGIDALLASYGYFREGPIYRTERNTEKTLALFCHFGIAAAVCGYLMGVSPINLWHGMVMLPTSVTSFVTEERYQGEVWLRCFGFGDVSHLYEAGEPLSPAALFPEKYTEENKGQVFEHLPAQGTWY